MTPTRLAALFALLTVTVSCSLLVSTEGLSERPTAAGDAASPGDATTDTLAEAAPPARDAGSSFCPDDAAFCASFEEADLTTGFTSSHVSQGASPSREPASATGTDSGTVLVSNVPAAPGDDAFARLLWKMPSTPSALRVELDAYLCDPGSGTLEYLKIEWGTPFEPDRPTLQSDALELFTGPQTGLAIERHEGDGGPAKAFYGALRTLPTQRWIHYSLEATFSTTAGRVRAVIDRDEASPLVDVQQIPTRSPEVKDARVVIGAFVAESTAACVARFDNVSVVLTP